MPPAGAKKGSAKKSNNAAAQPFNKNWEAGLVKAQFDEVCHFAFSVFYMVFRNLTRIYHQVFSIEK